MFSWVSLRRNTPPPPRPLGPPRPWTARPLLAWRHSNQLQMCSGSPSASEVVLKVLSKRVPPAVQGKFVRQQPELSAAPSELLIGRSGTKREETLQSQSLQKQLQKRINA